MFEPIKLSDEHPKKQIPSGYQEHLQSQFTKLVEARQHVIDCEAAVMKAQAAAIKSREKFLVSLAAIKQKLGADPTWDLTPDCTFLFEPMDGEEVLPEDCRKELPVDADEVLKGVSDDNDDRKEDFFNSIQGKL